MIQATDSTRNGWSAKSAAAPNAISALRAAPRSGASTAASRRANPRNNTAPTAWRKTFVPWYPAGSRPWSAWSKASVSQASGW
ncbi:MAG: hypothetical protein IPJ77_00590 [Planctomycetes bacterium]|nr:hypothetical protein [Planctomycetota bacterium]